MTSGQAGELVAGELYVESWGPSDAPALLYLHGGPGQGSYEFVRHQAALLASGLRVIALDQRGVLRSAALPPGRCLTLADLVADCETVRAHLGLESWALLGQSFGGMLALRYATEHPAAVTAVIFENPCWDVDRTCRSLLSAFVAHRTAAAHPQVIAAVTSMLATDADARTLWALLLQVIVAFGPDRDDIYTPDEDTRRAIRAVLASAPFTSDQWSKSADHLARLTEDPSFFAPHTPALRRLTQPSLLIKGELDPIPSAGEVLDFRRALPGAEVRVFAGSGHFVQAEKPQAYADLVTDFVIRSTGLR